MPKNCAEILIAIGMILISSNVGNAQQSFGSTAGTARNCSRLYRDSDLLSAAELSALIGVDQHASVVSRGDKDVYMAYMRDAFHAIEDPPRSRAARTSIAGYREAILGRTIAGIQEGDAEALKYKATTVWPESRVELLKESLGTGTTFIWNGEPDTPTHGGKTYFLSTVAITVPSQPLSICTGTRVAENTALTAAHCVCELELDKPERIRFIAWGNNADSPAYKSRILTEATACFPDSDGGSCERNFCATYRANRHEVTSDLAGKDLALVTFDKSQVPPAASIYASAISSLATAAFYNTTLNTPQETVFIAGFGWDPTASTGRLGQRRCGQMKVIDQNCSIPGNTTQFGCKSGREIVLRGDEPEKTDACPGDSGGGVFVLEEKNGDRHLHLVGAVSRGPNFPGKDTREQCGSWGIYSLTSDVAVLNWIKTTVGMRGQTVAIRDN